MKYLFVCPMDDTLRVSVAEVKGDHEIYGTLRFQTYTPPHLPLFPYVPAYFQQFQEQPKPLKQFFREYIRGFMPKECLLVLHDDATDLEANALSDLIAACGIKEVPMEYRAFLLSPDPAYLAVTGSKRSVAVTRIAAGSDETERIFIPVNEADPDTVNEALGELDPDGRLPVYTFGVSEQIARLGEEIYEPELVRNFLRIL